MIEWSVSLHLLEGHLLDPIGTGGVATAAMKAKYSCRTPWADLEVNLYLCIILYPYHGTI